MEPYVSAPEQIFQHRVLELLLVISGQLVFHVQVGKRIHVWRRKEIFERWKLGLKFAQNEGFLLLRVCDYSFGHEQLKRSVDGVLQSASTDMTAAVLRDVFYGQKKFGFGVSLM